MNDEVITFIDLSKCLSLILSKIDQLSSKLAEIQSFQQQEDKDEWMNMKEVRDFLPSHPAEQTIYGWTSTHQIPHHKKGRRLMFLKSEIEDWLKNSKVKSQAELMAEARVFVASKKKAV